MSQGFSPIDESVKWLSTLRSLAEALGWRGLEMWRHRLEDDTVLTWYSTSDEKFFLQINEDPPGQSNTYTAAVYADRYGYALVATHLYLATVIHYAT